MNPRRLLTALAAVALNWNASLGAGAAVAAEGTAVEASATETAAAPLPAADEESLVRYALAHNFELRAKLWDRDVASANVTGALALSNPVVRGEWLHVEAPEAAGWGVGLEWSPPRPGVFGAQAQAARARVRAVRADLSESAADLEGQVRTTYARILALDEELALAETSVGTRRTIQEATKQRVERGAASRIDLSLVAVSLLRGEQERDQLDLKRASAVAQLEALLGLPADNSLASRLAWPGRATLAGTRSIERDAQARDLVQRAIADRPILQADRARADAAREALGSESARRWPWLELQARYRRHDQSSYANDLTLGLEITLPILDGNAGPIAAATARQSQELALGAAHRLQIEHAVRALYAESARRANIADRYAESMAPVLREHALLVKAALEGQELDLMAVLAAEDMMTQGGIDYVEARLAERQAKIALARTLGQYGRSGVKGVE